MLCACAVVLRMLYGNIEVEHTDRIGLKILNHSTIQYVLSKAGTKTCDLSVRYY